MDSPNQARLKHLEAEMRRQQPVNLAIESASSPVEGRSDTPHNKSKGTLQKTGQTLSLAFKLAVLTGGLLLGWMLLHWVFSMIYMVGLICILCFFLWVLGAVLFPRK